MICVTSVAWTIFIICFTCMVTIDAVCSSEKNPSKNGESSLCQDGGWSFWGQWTMCSKTCNLPHDPAVRYRSRACNNPRPQNGGAQCSGPGSQTVECSHLKICDLDGGFTDWVVITSCQPIIKDKTCSKGLKYLRRVCTNPKPSGKGKQCQGRKLKQEPCWYEVGCSSDLQPPRNIYSYRNKQSLELNWQRTPWGSLAVAFEVSYWPTKSSNQKNSFTVIANKKHPYGENYTRTINDLIIGQTYNIQITSFNSHNHVSKQITVKIGSVDGRWSDWGFWSDCSSKCDRGTRTRQRSCTNPAPDRGGNSCQGHSKESQTCVGICYRT